MRNCALLAVGAAGALMMSGTAEAAVSAGDLYASDAPGVYWSSVRTKTRAIALDWPADATRAELTIQPLSQRAKAQPVELAAGTASYAWTPFAGDAPARDELYTLTLAYLNGETLVGSVQTAEVTVVRSAFAATTLPVDPASDSWKAANGAAIVPYDAGWFTNAQAGATAALVRTKVGTGLAVTNDLTGAGWFGWNFRRSGFGSSGVFALTLGNGDASEDKSAELLSVPTGSLMMLK